MSHDRVNFTDTDADQLRRVTWAFWFHERALVVDSYIIESRPTKRHNFKIARAYFRLPVGMGALLDSEKIAEADVPLTDEIRDRALREFVSQIKVVRWSEVSRR
jgi:hypothetical protein